MIVISDQSRFPTLSARNSIPEVDSETCNISTQCYTAIGMRVIEIVKVKANIFIIDRILYHFYIIFHQPFFNISIYLQITLLCSNLDTAICIGRMTRAIASLPSLSDPLARSECTRILILLVKSFYC